MPGERPRRAAAVWVGLASFLLFALGGAADYGLWSGWKNRDGVGWPAWPAAVVLLVTAAVAVGGVWAVSRLARGKPWIAGQVVYVTLVLTAWVGFLGVFILSLSQIFSSCSLITTEPGCSGWGGLVGALIPAAICLMWGLGKAWQVAAGRNTRRGVQGAVLAGRAWHVSEPGTNLTDSPGGTQVARLSGGAGVVEVERQGDFIKVTTRDGRTGWVDRRSVF